MKDVRAATAWQESHYGDHVDYRKGSPHLANVELYGRLVAMVRSSLAEVVCAGLAANVLEIGSGHGGYTEPLLASGASVTAVEVSRPSLERLHALYGANDRFAAIYDPLGHLECVSNKYAMVLAVSVVHHIPDYLSFLDSAAGRLEDGGVLLTLQDPLWYPRLAKSVHAFDRIGYYCWRLGQGDLARGMSTLRRRLVRTYDDEEASDMVEYHVVRNGVDEEALTARLRSSFRTVETIRYWSNQSEAAQRLGVRLGITNTFGVVAKGFGGTETT